MLGFPDRSSFEALAFGSRSWAYIAAEIDFKPIGVQRILDELRLRCQEVPWNFDLGHLWPPTSDPRRLVHGNAEQDWFSEKPSRRRCFFRSRIEKSEVCLRQRKRKARRPIAKGYRQDGANGALLPLHACDAQR